MSGIDVVRLEVRYPEMGVGTNLPGSYTGLEEARAAAQGLAAKEGVHLKQMCALSNGGLTRKQLFPPEGGTQSPAMGNG